MELVNEPQVFLIAQPVIDTYAMREYLRAVGGESWLRRVIEEDEDGPDDAELLVEFMGRLCYRSWEPGLNANVTRIREDHGDYLLNVLRSGHGSVLEHATFSFVVHNASRVLTAELNRHRAGTAISEQSLRYVRLDQLSFRLPPVLSPQLQREMRSAVEKVEGSLAELVRLSGISEMQDFHSKKVITSALRRLAPMGMATEIGWSANIRTIRHVIEMRSAQGAEEEIRVFANQLAEVMQKKCPLLFGDYVRAYPDGREGQVAWVTQNRKV